MHRLAETKAEQGAVGFPGRDFEKRGVLVKRNASLVVTGLGSREANLLEDTIGRHLAFAEALYGKTRQVGIYGENGGHVLVSVPMLESARPNMVY